MTKQEKVSAFTGTRYYLAIHSLVVSALISLMSPALLASHGFAFAATGSPRPETFPAIYLISGAGTCYQPSITFFAPEVGACSVKVDACIENHVHLVTCPGTITPLAEILKQTIERQKSDEAQNVGRLEKEIEAVRERLSAWESKLPEVVPKDSVTDLAKRISDLQQRVQRLENGTPPAASGLLR